MHKARMHVRTYPRARTHARTHAHTHARTHTHTFTHTHTLYPRWRTSKKAHLTACASCVFEGTLQIGAPAEFSTPASYHWLTMVQKQVRSCFYCPPYTQRWSGQGVWQTFGKTPPLAHQQRGPPNSMCLLCIYKGLHKDTSKTQYSWALFAASSSHPYNLLGAAVAVSDICLRPPWTPCLNAWCLAAM